MNLKLPLLALLCLLPGLSSADEVAQLLARTSTDIIKKCGQFELPNGSEYTLSAITLTGGQLQITEEITSGFLDITYHSIAPIDQLIAEARYENGRLTLECKYGKGSCFTKTTQSIVMDEYEEEQIRQHHFGYCSVENGADIAKQLTQAIRRVNNGSCDRRCAVQKVQTAFNALENAANSFSGTVAEETSYENHDGFSIRDWKYREYSYIKFSAQNSNYCQLNFTTEVIKKSNYGNDDAMLMGQILWSSSNVPVDLTSNNTRIYSTSSKFDANNIGCIKIEGLPAKAVKSDYKGIGSPARDNARYQDNVNLYCGVKYMKDRDQPKVNELFLRLQQLQTSCLQNN